MVRIVRDPNKKGTGAPRGSASGVSARVSAATARVSRDVVSRSGIRRLIARDPAKGVSANIGTRQDRVNLSGFRKGIQSFLVTAMAGANNDMVFTARVVGTVGNNVRVRIVVAGTNTPLTVGVSGNDVTINSATDGGGAVTSTANAVIAAVNASAPAMALLYPVTLSGADNGTGLVAAFAFTNLAGGADSVLEGTDAVGSSSPGGANSGAIARSSTPTHKNVSDRGANRSVKRLK